jgi:hypothetical protein
MIMPMNKCAVHQVLLRLSNYITYPRLFYLYTINVILFSQLCYLNPSCKIFLHVGGNPSTWRKPTTFFAYAGVRSENRTHELRGERRS